MPWYGWLAVAGGACVVAGVIGFGCLRASERGRQFLALGGREKLRFARALLRDRHVRWYAKLPIVLTIAYLAMPIDIVPDFVPVLGQLDDVAVIALAMVVTLWLVPRSAFEAALNVARGTQESERTP